MVLALFVAAAMLLSACGQAKKPEATTAPESVAEEVSEAVSEAAEEVTEAISEAAEDISEAASEAAEEVTEAVSEVVEEVSEAAEEVKEEASEVAEEITDAAEEVKEEAADAAEEVKEEASEAVEDVKEEASDTAEEVKEEVSEAVEEVKEEASDIAEEVMEEVSETVEEVKEDAAAVVEDAKDKAEEVKEEAAAIVEDAKDKAEEVVEDVKDKAEEVKEEAAAVVEDAKDKAEEIVEDVTAEAEETAEEAAGLTAPMTYEEYAAAEIDDEVFVEAYVQNHQSWWEDKITVYAADEDGAYFIYEMACSEEDAAKLVPGTKILVRGYKAEWSGEVEIADATFEFAEEDGEGYIAEAEDITDLLGKDELIDHMNEFVSFKGLKVELSKDADGKEAPFLYNWDGSGTQGDDLYFNASINGETFTFTVESYLCDKDTDVYKAVEALKAGDVVDMEGFLYWYNGANPHITSVTVKEAKEEAVETAEEVKEDAAEAAEEVKEEAVEAVEEVKEDASNIVEDAKDKVVEAVEDAKDIGAGIIAGASDVVEDIKDKVVGAVEDVKEGASEKAEEAAEAAEEVKEDASETIEEVKEEAAAVVEDAKDKAEEVKEEAAAVIEDAKDKAEEIVEDVTAEAKEAAEEAVEQAAELTAPMTYAEYAAAEIDDEVFVEAYVQNHQSWWEDKITVYAADEDGAYFIYEMACSEEDAAKLVPGTKILVRGYKAEWSGEVEIADATFEFAEEDGAGYIAEAEDITELLGKDELIDHMNEFVSFKGLTIEPSKDADEKEAPFLYNWDGSGTQGDDLYFNASVNGETFTFTVESYLCDKDTDVYKAVEALKAGDVVDMEGFLYWYNGANPHIISVTVVK